MKTDESFDYHIRDDENSADRTTWKAVAATLFCAGVTLLLLIAARTALEIYPEPSQLMDPPIVQAVAEPEPTQYAKAPPVERLGN